MEKQQCGACGRQVRRSAPTSDGWASTARSMGSSTSMAWWSMRARAARPICHEQPRHHHPAHARVPDGQASGVARADDLNVWIAAGHWMGACGGRAVRALQPHRAHRLCVGAGARATPARPLSSCQISLLPRHDFRFAATIADGFGMRRSTITGAVPRTTWPTLSGLDRGVLCLNKKNSLKIANELRVNLTLCLLIHDILNFLVM